MCICGEPTTCIRHFRGSNPLVGEQEILVTEGEQPTRENHTPPGVLLFREHNCNKVDGLLQVLLNYIDYCA